LAEELILVIRYYKCPNCGEFETKTSIKEDVLKDCPACGEELKRKFILVDTLFCTMNKHRLTGINPQKEFPILVKDD